MGLHESCHLKIINCKRESGTDLGHIQTLLGHNSSKTTEIYTKVTFSSIQNVKSPLDYIS